MSTDHPYVGFRIIAKDKAAAGVIDMTFVGYSLNHCKGVVRTRLYAQYEDALLEFMYRNADMCDNSKTMSIDRECSAPRIRSEGGDLIMLMITGASMSAVQQALVSQPVRLRTTSVVSALSEHGHHVVLRCGGQTYTLSSVEARFIGRVFVNLDGEWERYAGKRLLIEADAVDIANAEAADKCHADAK